MTNVFIFDAHSNDQHALSYLESLLQRDITMSPRATTVVGWSSSLRALW